MQIRQATYADRAAVEAVTAVAFGEEPEGRVVTLMRTLESTGAARVGLVAVHEDEVVGHVGLSRGWVDARQALVEVLVLSPLSVHPDHQRRGVGTALVAAAVAFGDDRGWPAVFLEGGGDCYGARGFVSGASQGFDRPSVRIPERAFQVAVLTSHEPWMVGRLVYPEAFWLTDTAGVRDPRLARIAELSTQANDVGDRT